MSIKTTKSGNSVSESLLFVEWSDYNENRLRYEGEFIEQSEPDIWNPNAQNATVIRYDKDCPHDLEKRRKYKRLSEYNSGLHEKDCGLRVI